eukprot:9854614-Alexandrium_andersonii.AAC.1
MSIRGPTPTRELQHHSKNRDRGESEPRIGVLCAGLGSCNKEPDPRTNCSFNDAMAAKGGQLRAEWALRRVKRIKR